MTLEDLDAVLTIEEASFAEPWSRSALEGELGAVGGAAFVLKLPPRPGRPSVAGYVSTRCLLDEIHVMRIAVHPEERRQGAAERLMQHVFEALARPPMTCILLEVRAGNLPALRFYGRLGFREIGRRKGYYGKTGEDAVVMRRNVPKEEL